MSTFTGSPSAASNESLSASYRLVSPLYDLFVSPALGRARARSIAALGPRDGERVLLVGMGTGLDLPLLPARARVSGFDLTPAMLLRARRRARASAHEGGLFVGDAHSLPFPEGSFDVVVLHLILAIVPDARRAFREAARVLSPGGRIGVLDKFLPKGESPGRVRSLADGLLRPWLTGFNTRFEELLEDVPALRVVSDEPEVLGRLFRRLVLVRDA